LPRVLESELANAYRAKPTSWRDGTARAVLVESIGGFDSVKPGLIRAVCLRTKGSVVRITPGVPTIRFTTTC